MFSYDKICEEIKMPPEAAALARECLDRIGGDSRLEAIRDAFYRGEDVIPHLAAFARQRDEHELMVNLAFCFFCVGRMYEEFKHQGLCDRVYLDSLIDIRVWALTCRKNYGEWGMKEFDWLARALRGRLYRLGRLQFELVPFEYDGYDKYGAHIKKGDTVINTHIPEDGPMPASARIDAYKRAYTMFGFGNFVCESYLLYPAQYDFLPAESNIIEFMNEFDIIYSEENDKMNDMWRIFGLRDSYDAASLPRDTSLQRAYADHIAATGKNGWGYGVMIFDGEKICRK